MPIDRLTSVISATPPGANASQMAWNGKPVASPRPHAAAAASVTIKTVETAAAIITRNKRFTETPAKRAPMLVPITNDGSSFSGQLIGALTIFVWVFVASLIVWAILKAIFGIRVSEEDEYEGMDIVDCGMEAYPEFVKS